MKKKNILIISILFVIIISIIGVYYVFTKEDKNTTLTLLEKQWIENNKNEMIDFAIVNNIAILNDSTESLIFDFIEDLEKTTGLDFNEKSYDYGDKINESYAFKTTKEISDKDILVYSDNYVLVGKDKVKYNSLSDIKPGVVAVLSSDLKDATKYIDNEEMKYKSLDSKYLDMLISFNDGDTDFDYVVIPKLLFLSYSENYNNLYINYNITELNDNYVISLGKTKRLNDILTKYYKKWEKDNFNDIYTKEFINAYYKFSNTDEQEKVKFRSKRYTYGFVDNAPFDLEANGKLYGINSSILKSFSKTTNAEIVFEKYDTVKELKEAFKTNKIDIIFDKYSKEKYDIDIYNTVSVGKEEIVIISETSNNKIINSLNSLENLVVATLKNSKIEEELKGKCKKIITYDNLSKLLKYNGIKAIDSFTYEFYQNKELKNHKVDYTFELDGDYTYLVRDIKNNKVFENFLNFYITYINEETYIQEGYNNSYSVSLNSSNMTKLFYTVISIICLVVSFLLGSKIFPSKTKNKKIKISMKKEDKLRYVDMLTSLKNRNYLNDNIEAWDDSEIYPQSILILDLNNIAYINDNYGHQEGDNIIKQAANVLISNQITNSDIIRTNGNEFLIYLVGYEEKQVVTYKKKLIKEMKELDHGFGAAIGYSMITDGIKTIDDAINEATLDMRNNKEELNN